ncbi:MAG: CBS domain-containing protein [Saprospiraceae bacterium]
MTAQNLISQSILPLKPTDTGLVAMDLLGEYHLRHLPVVQGDQLLGLISEDDLLEFDLGQTLDTFPMQFSRPSVSAHNHLYEILRLMADFRLTSIPVVSKEDRYLGLITQEDLISKLGNMGSFTLPGSIIVLKMHRRDYSLARISSIIEQENAAVISTFITSDLQSNQAEVTLKVNKKDISRIVASLERFDFNVKASFHESEFINESIKERYESLMMYLNV